MAFIRPERFPALTQIDAFEWTSDIRSMGNVATAVGFFRDFFVFMNSTSAGFTTHAVASFSANVRQQDIIATSAMGFLRGTAIGLSGQFDLFSSHAVIDGLALTDASGRYVRYWQNIDGLGGTGSQCVNTNEITKLASSTLCLASPKQVTFRLERIGRVVSPNENLFRDSLTGEFRPLGAGTDGNGYNVWRLRIREGSSWGDLALFYEPVSEPLNLAQPYSLAPEAPSNFPGSPTYADSPARIDYTGIRIWDSSKWIDFTDFFVYAESMSAVDNDHGYSVRDAFGKITSHIGVSGLKTNKYVLGPGLTFQSTSGVTLTSIGTQTYGSFTGDVFQLGASTYPYIQHEEDRGVWLLHPEVGTGAQLVFTADYKGTHHFVGDFARASTNLGSGDGAICTVLSQSGSTLAGSTIGSANVVDDTSYDTIFAGTGVFHFDVTRDLEVGETVRFRVTAGATKTDDVTAFRFTERSFVKTGSLRTAAVKGEFLYVPPGYLRQTLPNEAGRPGRLVSAHGLRHEVYYFDDADDLESWRTCPEGAIALAVAQSESDSASDVNAIIDQENRIRFHSASGNRKCWLHVWRRASRKPSSNGVDTPPPVHVPGSVPRGTGQWSADATLASDNLTNGRAIGFHAHRHRVYGIERVVNGDTLRVIRSATSLAFQPLYGQLRHVRVRLTERTSRYATVTFDVSGDEVDGDLHVWSR